MTCSKCGDVLSSKETRIGKGKCATCLVKGYKFAIGLQMAETEKAQKEAAHYKHKLDNAKLIMEAKDRKIELLEAQVGDYECIIC